MRAREYVSPKSELLLGLRDRLKCAMAASAAAINGDWNVQLEDNGKQAQPDRSRSFAPDFRNAAPKIQQFQRSPHADNSVTL